jgi:hypothetical protein
LLKWQSLKYNNGTFISNANQFKPVSFFDGEHIDFNKINGTFKNILLLKDTLTANLDLNCKERSGLNVKQLKAKYKVNPQIMEFSNLNLETNNSKLGNYYAMKFKRFNEDFSNYISNVVMLADFNGATVHSSDIAFFAPALNTINRNILLSGKYNGTVADFNITNLFAKSGASIVRGNLKMKGLPNFEQTLISLNNGAVYTNASDLKMYIPLLKTFTNPNIAALGNIIYRGSFNGYYNNFKTKGNLSTNLGAVYSDLELKFIPKKEPTYTGFVNTQQFNLGKFINSTLLGNIAFQGKVSGSSFTLNKMKTTFDGDIKKLDLNNYTYTNITTLGTFEKQAFNGQVKIADPNLDFIGIMQIDLTEAKPKFNLFADILKSNYKELKLTPHLNLQVTGTLDVNLKGTNIDNFEGEAKLMNAVVKNNNESIKFDSLVLASNWVNNKKQLQNFQAPILLVLF